MYFFEYFFETFGHSEPICFHQFEFFNKFNLKTQNPRRNSSIPSFSAGSVEHGCGGIGQERVWRGESGMGVKGCRSEMCVGFNQG